MVNNFVCFCKKNFKFMIVVIILILFQVFFDLTIPNYTYNFIDTGIFNEGVKEDVPLVIRRSSMKSLTDYMSDTDKEKVLNSYSFINKKYERYIKKYPILEKEAIYILNGDRIKGIEDILENAILLELSDTYPKVEKEIPKLVTKENESLKDAFKRLDEEDKELFIDKFEDNKKNISDLTINNYINNYIKNEYKEVGYKTSTTRCYLVTTFLKLLVIFLLKLGVGLFLIKKIHSYSLNITKELSKKILSKASKLTFKQIKEIDVESLIVKGNEDIKNFPILIFTLLEEIVYIVGFFLLFFLVLNKNINTCLFLMFTILEGIVIYILIKFVLKKYKRKKYNKLIISYYLLMIIEVLLLLLFLIFMIIISCLKINYISFLKVSLGEFLWMIIVSIELVVSLFTLVLFVLSSIKVNKISKKIRLLLETKEYIKEPSKPVKIRKNAKRKVEFKDIYSNVSFKINANGTFGILCSNREECNNITRMLLKQELIKNGDILIDGVSINDLELSSLRTKICCFYPKNVWYYEEDLESTKFLKSPDIYLVNDFYGDLDLEKDDALSYFLTKKQKNKIVIIITVNVNNLTNANNIAIIKKNKLIALGKHKDLIKTSKEYQSILKKVGKI